ncbi:MAG: hypothetical protein LUM44_22545 [Pyrinomonadaceae bacterium]|nr:hypothetical protein [Pyrinomonadaceae bacterium]
MKIFISLLLTVFTINLVNAQKKPIAVVTRLEGKAEIKTGDDGDTKLLVKKERLFAGQSVRCDRGKGCRALEISYCQNMPDNKIKDTWSLILHFPCKATSGRIAGEPKSEKDIIIYPNQSETLRLQNFSIRWKPLEPSVKLELTVEIDLGEEIYHEKEIDGSKGMYESAGLLKKLKEAQAVGEFSFNIILTEPGDKKTKLKEPQIRNFILLLSEKEKSLNEKLKLLEDETDEIFKLSGRALILGNYRLYAESAQEMEKVLALPEVMKMGRKNKALSKILTLAATSNYKAMQTERTKILCRKLIDLGSPLPKFACDR